MALNAGNSLDGPHKAHGLRNVMRVDHLTYQNHFARFDLCLDQCPCIAAKMPLRAGRACLLKSYFIACQVVLLIDLGQALRRRPNPTTGRRPRIFPAAARGAHARRRLPVRGRHHLAHHQALKATASITQNRHPVRANSRCTGKRRRRRSLNTNLRPRHPVEFGRKKFRARRLLGQIEIICFPMGQAARPGVGGSPPTAALSPSWESPVAIPNFGCRARAALSLTDKKSANTKSRRSIASM